MINEFFSWNINMKVTEAKSEDKKAELKRLLAKGAVMVFVDSRKEGVHVPSQHGGNARLPLNLDYAFEIPDFRILDDRVEVSLSFNQTPFPCRFPFSAIYILTSQISEETVVFPDDFPRDLMVSSLNVPSPPKGKKAAPPKKKKPALSLVKPSRKKTKPKGKKKSPAKKKKRKSTKQKRRPKLKLVSSS